jgi:hypothetical protein
MSYRNTVITYPIPLYQNVPIHAEYYKPRQFFISAIMLGFLTTVTTTINHDYCIGQLVRLLIPNGFGSRQLNEMLGFVTSIPAQNQVVLDLNSSNADPFITNVSIFTQPQIVAVGDINTGEINPCGPNMKPWIPASFRNISPRGCEWQNQ